MAKIIFGEGIDSITGKIGGTVFQRSLGGYQIRNRSTPRNPQLTTQQVPRSLFGQLAATWRTLTHDQQLTFNAVVPMQTSLFNAYMLANLNLIAAGQPTINEYPGGTEPIVISGDINTITPTSVVIETVALPFSIPADHTLLVYMLPPRLPGLTWWSAEHQILIKRIPAGDPVPQAYDVTSDYINRLGNPVVGSICSMNLHLISNLSGLRSAESTNQTVVTEPV